MQVTVTRDDHFMFEPFDGSESVDIGTMYLATDEYGNTETGTTPSLAVYMLIRCHVDYGTYVYAEYNGRVVCRGVHSEPGC